jgi:hypothetical protein
LTNKSSNEDSTTKGVNTYRLRRLDARKLPVALRPSSMGRLNPVLPHIVQPPLHCPPPHDARSIMSRRRNPASFRGDFPHRVQAVSFSSNLVGAYSQFVRQIEPRSTGVPPVEHPGVATALARNAAGASAASAGIRLHSKGGIGCNPITSMGPPLLNLGLI